MKWFSRTKKQSTTSIFGIETVAANVDQDSTESAEPATATPQRSRRGLLGLGIAAAAGATALFQSNSKTAEAASAGNFSSSVSSTPAVTASGTNGARGVQASSDRSYAIYGNSAGNIGIWGKSGTSYGVMGIGGTNRAGVLGTSSTSAGVLGTSTALATNKKVSVGVQGSGADIGVYGIPSVATGIGVYGLGISEVGVVGYSSGSLGVSGTSEQSIGVSGQSTAVSGVSGQINSIGVYGAGNDAGVVGYANSSSSYAGYFYGKVYTNGSLSNSGGGLLIDHPLDPANKSLYHSFVESPDMKNIYDGVVTLDANGEAFVTLPDWFGALNSNFRYQLTCLGGYAPVYIANKIEKNQFKIAGGHAGMEISWQVTGIRQDRWAEKNRIPVEVEKPAVQRGLYYHPELYGQTREKSFNRLPTSSQPTTPPKA